MKCENSLQDCDLDFALWFGMVLLFIFIIIFSFFNYFEIIKFLGDVCLRSEFVDFFSDDEYVEAKYKFHKKRKKTPIILHTSIPTVFF